MTFGIWLVAGYYFTKRISDAESRAAAIDTRYMQAQELLSTVRAQVLLGSVYVRDALLDPNPATSEYRRQLEDTYAGVDRALQEYVPVLDSAAERERVARLRREIDEFREHDAAGAGHRQHPLAGRSAGAAADADRARSGRR